MTQAAKQKPDTIAAHARAALDDAGGDVRQATALMVERIKKDAAAFEALTEPLIKEACYSQITMACRRERRAIWTAPNYDQGGNGARVINLAHGNLLAFPLPGGKRLGQATKEDVAKAATFFDAQAEDMARKARWLLAIGDALADGQIVLDVFDDEGLRNIKDCV